MADMQFQNFYNGTNEPEIVSKLVPENTVISAGEIVNDGILIDEIAKPGDTAIPSDLFGIALEDVATGAGETAHIAVMVAGAFNKDKVIFPNGKTINDYYMPLRNKGIYLVEAMISELNR